MKIKIDEATCIGCGSCVVACPAVFSMNDAGKAEARPDDNKEIKCDYEEIAKACPSGSIILKTN